jgi:hypothetical protein
MNIPGVGKKKNISVLWCGFVITHTRGYAKRAKTPS